MQEAPYFQSCYLVLLRKRSFLTCFFPLTERLEQVDVFEEDGNACEATWAVHVRKVL